MFQPFILFYNFSYITYSHTRSFTFYLDKGDIPNTNFSNKKGSEITKLDRGPRKYLRLSFDLSQTISVLLFSKKVSQVTT